MVQPRIGPTIGVSASTLESWLTFLLIQFNFHQVSFSSGWFKNVNWAWVDEFIRLTLFMIRTFFCSLAASCGDQRLSDPSMDLTSESEDVPMTSELSAANSSATGSSSAQSAIPGNFSTRSVNDVNLHDDMWLISLSTFFRFLTYIL